MTTFTTNPGVDVFETGGPHGLLRIETGKPFTTEDQREISILSIDGAHALTQSAGKPAAKQAAEATRGGDES
jgi:hypothetical protein